MLVQERYSTICNSIILEKKKKRSEKEYKRIENIKKNIKNTHTTRSPFRQL